MLVVCGAVLVPDLEDVPDVLHGLQERGGVSAAGTRRQEQGEERDAGDDEMLQSHASWASLGDRLHRKTSQYGLLITHRLRDCKPNRGNEGKIWVFRLDFRMFRRFLPVRILLADGNPLFRSFMKPS